MFNREVYFHQHQRASRNNLIFIKLILTKRQVKSFFDQSFSSLISQTDTEKGTFRGRDAVIVITYKRYTNSRFYENCLSKVRGITY